MTIDASQRLNGSFRFLSSFWPDLHELGEKAERAAEQEPDLAAIRLRGFTEAMVEHLRHRGQRRAEAADPAAPLHQGSPTTRGDQRPGTASGPEGKGSWHAALDPGGYLFIGTRSRSRLRHPATRGRNRL